MNNTTIFRAVIMLICGLVFASGGMAQDMWLDSEYLWRETTFEIDDKFENRLFHYMTNDEAGYVWIASSIVRRFDGLKFDEVPGLEISIKDQEELTICPGPEGSIWLAKHSIRGIRGFTKSFVNLDQQMIDSRSLEYESPERFFRDNPPPVSFEEVVNMFCQNDGSDCYLGLRDGRILRYDKGEWSLLSFPEKAEGDLLQHLSFAKDGHRWAVYPNRCYILDDLGTRKLTYPLNIPEYAFKGDGGTGGTLIGNQVSLRFDRLLLPDLPNNSDEIEKIMLPPYSHKLLYAKVNNQELVFRADSLHNRSYITTIQGDKIAELYSRKFNSLRMVDDLGRYWMSTPEGFLVGEIKKRRIHKILDEDGKRVSFRGIVAVDDNLWVNTYSGVFKIPFLGDGRMGKAVKLNNLRPSGRGLSVGLDGEIYSGVYGRHFFTVDPETARAKAENISPHQTGRSQTNYIFQSENNCLWGLTYNGVRWKEKGGLWNLLPATEAYQFYYGLEDEEGVWLTGDNGLLLLDPTTHEVIDDFPALHGLPVYHFARNADDFVLATDKGIAIWVKGSADYRLIDLQGTGLPKQVHAVYLVGENIAFYSTNDGIFKYNLVTGDYFKVTKEFGMPNNECNQLSHYRSDDGTLFFGTVQGGAYFHPDSIFEPNLIRDSHLVFDKAETFRDGEWQVLNRASVEPDMPLVLTLYPEDVLLRFGFSLPRNPALNQVLQRYRTVTDGSEGWILFEDGRFQLNKLAPGDYDIEVAGTFSNGMPAGETISLHLIVLPPIYQRWWFVWSVMLLVTFGMVLIYRYRRLYYIRQQEELTFKIKEATERINRDKELMSVQNIRLNELNGEKEKLLSIIAHDLKGPFNSLQGIGAKVNFLLKQSDFTRLGRLSDDVENIVARCSATLNNLLLTNNIERLSRAPSDVDILIEFENQLELLESMANIKGVSLKFICQESTLTLSGIRYALNSLFRNLLMNAIQFAPRGSEVLVELEKSSENAITLSVHDQGKGMTKKQVKRLIIPFCAEEPWEPSEHSTGLGWRVIRMVAGVHNAKIQIDSTVKRGTSVMVVFFKKTSSSLLSSVSSRNDGGGGGHERRRYR